MEISPSGMDYPIEKIAEMSTWTYYQGFSGESCGKCKATANVLAGGAGWFCPCGHYNFQLLFHHQPPHEMPTYGPSKHSIKEGHAMAEMSKKDKLLP